MLSTLIHSDINIMLNKLRGRGVTGRLWDWLRSYLVGRRQYVVFNGSGSYEFEPVWGGAAITNLISISKVWGNAIEVNN